MTLLVKKIQGASNQDDSSKAATGHRRFAQKAAERYHIMIQTYDSYVHIPFFNLDDIWSDEKFASRKSPNFTVLTIPRRLQLKPQWYQVQLYFEGTSLDLGVV